MKSYKEMIEELLAFGFSPEEIAAKVGTSRVSIFNWRSEKWKPIRTHRRKLEKLYSQEVAKRGA